MEFVFCIMKNIYLNSSLQYKNKKYKIKFIRQLRYNMLVDVTAFYGYKANLNTLLKEV